jgi:hypothetical protein
MTRICLPGALLVLASLVACGGNDTREVNCEANLKYQNRVEGKRVVAPEGLDQLDELAELRVPRADPNAPATPEGVCIDSPPVISTGS